MCIYHACSFTLMIKESNFSVNCYHLISFQKCHKNKFMFGKLHYFSRKIFRWCLTFDAVYIMHLSQEIQIWVLKTEIDFLYPRWPLSAAVVAESSSF